MKKIIISTVLLLALSVNCYSLDVMSGAVGYAVGKSWKGQAVSQVAPVLGYLPIECWLNGNATCGMGSREIKLTEVCHQIAPNYSVKGFMPTGRKGSYVIILCGADINWGN